MESVLLKCRYVVPLRAEGMADYARFAQLPPSVALAQPLVALAQPLVSPAQPLVSCVF